MSLGKGIVCVPEWSREVFFDTPDVRKDQSQDSQLALPGDHARDTGTNEVTPHGSLQDWHVTFDLGEPVVGSCRECSGSSGASARLVRARYVDARILNKINVVRKVDKLGTYMYRQVKCSRYIGILK